MFYIALFLRTFLLLSPIMLFFYQENGLNYKHLFLFQGIFYLTSIVAEFPVGYICDFFPRRNIIVTSFIIYITMLLLWLTFHGFGIVLMGEILFAISKVMMDNATSGYLYDYLVRSSKENFMVKYYGYLNFFLAAGTAFAGICGSYIYVHSGSQIILITEILFMSAATISMLFLPNIKRQRHEKPRRRIKEFIAVTKNLCKNNEIKYHICYSGVLTAFSILFVIGFQPIMQNALFPIYVFGIVTFVNHGIRAISSFLAGKVKKYISIKAFVKPLYALYIFAFTLIFLTGIIKNKLIIFILLTIICLIIGCQLLFSIMHVSRLHKFVDIKHRGSLMSVNNTVSRGLTAAVLISSKFFLDKISLLSFYQIAFGIFIVINTYVMLKLSKIED